MNNTEMTLREQLAFEYYVAAIKRPCSLPGVTAKGSFANADAWLAERDKAVVKPEVSPDDIPPEHPRTADGVVMYVGMTIWNTRHDREAKVVCLDDSPGVIVNHDVDWVKTWLELSERYSTREAANAAEGS